IYDDAPLVCDLLEKHSIEKAHFHWFKGDKETIDRMIENGYSISVTPDVLYKENTMNLVKAYPLELMMLETDVPWAFEGPFCNRLTHPKMIHKSIEKVAEIKRLPCEEVGQVIFNNTKRFYNI